MHKHLAGQADHSAGFNPFKQPGGLVGVVLVLVRLWALVVGCMVSGDRCRCIGCRAVQGGWSRPAAWRWWFGLARVHPHPAFWSYYSVLCVAMATDGERRLYIIQLQ